MRVFLISSMKVALELSGCATSDLNAVPPVIPADTSAKPGSGPGAAPSSGAGNTGPQFIE